MTEPSTIVVVDKDGNKHWASRTSKFVVDGLADGSLREVDDAPVPAPGADHNTGTADGTADSGPGDGERSADPAGDEVGDGVAGAETDRGARRRR